MELEQLESHLTALRLEVDADEKKDIIIPEDFRPRSIQVEGSDAGSEVSSSGRRKVQVRLPKFELKKFSGDPVDWNEFYESFNVAVHDNPDLTNIERFTYLKGYLTNEASRCIEGLAVTAANYHEARRLLKDRFGNRNLIISKHMDALLSLEPVKSTNSIGSLRLLYDKIMMNVRALKSFDISSNQFGPMLTPVILQKLPSNIKLEVGRHLKGEWHIDNVLELLHEEIQTQETCYSLNVDDKRDSVGPKRRDERPTTGSLHVGATNVKCIFCRDNHFSDKCTKILDIDERFEFVKH